MERRVTVVVAMFVGAVALLGTWLLLTNDPTVPRSETRAEIETVDPDGAAVAAERDPRAGRVDPRLAGRGSRELLVDNPHLMDDLRSRLRPPGATLATSGLFALDSDGIADAVDARRAQLDDCYGTALLHAPDLPASLSLSLEVTPSPGATWGRVTSVDATGVQDADVFETCAEGALGALRFVTDEPSTVTVPVVLSPDAR